MKEEEAILYLEHTGKDDFNLEEHQIQNRLKAIQTIINKNKQLESNWNELKKLLEEEQDRLVREISHTYEDSLDKTHFVNEDIYNELTKISEKMQELESKDD